jgi:hypothetical protein
MAWRGASMFNGRSATTPPGLLLTPEGLARRGCAPRLRVDLYSNRRGV